MLLDTGDTEQINPRTSFEKSDRSLQFQLSGQLTPYRGAETESALPPIFCLVFCMTKLQMVDDRRDDRTWMSEVGVNRFMMYSGAWPTNTLYTNTHSMYWIRSALGS